MTMRRVKMRNGAARTCYGTARNAGADGAGVVFRVKE
jgi:hypothetical protein